MKFRGCWLGSIVCLLLLGGCCHRQQATRTETRDSVVTEVIPRIERVTTPAITTSMDLQIECDPQTLKPKPVKKKESSKGQSLNADLDANGNLHIECKTDSLEHEIEVRDTTIKHLREVKNTEYREVPAPTPWYDKAARAVCIIVILLVALKYIIKAIRP